MTQKKATKINLDASKRSSDALKLLSTPADISKGMSEVQLQNLLTNLKNFGEYLDNEEYAKADTNNFPKNNGKLITRLVDLQTQAIEGWGSAKTDTRKDYERAKLYSAIKDSAAECITQLNTATIPVLTTPQLFREHSPHPTDILSAESPPAPIVVETPWKATRISLPTRTKRFLPDDEAVLGRVRELFADMISPYMNFTYATSQAERNMYIKEIAKAAPAFVKYLESVNPVALEAIVCGMDSPNCATRIAGLKAGDPQTMATLLTEGNSPLAESMDAILTSGGGTYDVEVPFLVMHPSLQVALGKRSHIEANLLVIETEKITEERSPAEGPGGQTSTYSTKKEYRFSPELRLGTELSIPPSKETRLKMGIEGGVGAYNPFFLKRGKYVVGALAEYSVNYEANVTPKSSIKMDVSVEGKRGFEGKHGPENRKAFTELLERAELIFMTFQFGKRVGLGVVARADAVQLFADSFRIPLYGITADAGLAHQLILYKDQGSTVNLYFAGGYTKQMDKLQGLPANWAQGGFVQLNTGREGKVSGGLTLRFLEPRNIRGLPAGRSPWRFAVGGTLRFDF